MQSRNKVIFHQKKAPAGMHSRNKIIFHKKQHAASLRTKKRRFSLKKGPCGHAQPQQSHFSLKRVCFLFLPSPFRVKGRGWGEWGPFTHTAWRALSEFIIN